MPSTSDALTRLAREITSPGVRTASLPNFADEASDVAQKVNSLFRGLEDMQRRYVKDIEQGLNQARFNLRPQNPVYIDVTIPDMNIPGYKTTDAYRGWGGSGTKITVFLANPDEAELDRMIQYMVDTYGLLATRRSPRGDSAEFLQR